MSTHVTSPEFVGSHVEAPAPVHEARASGVSWGAVIGGSFAIAALYLILLALGAGFGLSAVSPWSSAGLTAATAGAIAIAWLVIIEVIASAFGGYLTGRLRTKWTLVHSDEVFFRDTANGFLAWAVALVVSATLLAGAATVMAGGSAAVAGSFGRVSASPANATESTLADPNRYFVDALFRSGRVGADAGDAAVRAEAERIFVRGLTGKELPSADQSYLATLVAARTGLSQPEAERRVSDVTTEARQAEDTLRKATAHLLLWLFLSLLLGAFSASCAATIGGRQRDHVQTV
jgi:hypothetical protein